MKTQYSPATNLNHRPSPAPPLLLLNCTAGSSSIVLQRHLNIERRSGNVALVPHRHQHVVAALANVVVDRVRIFAGVLGLHLFAWTARMVQAHKQDARALIDFDGWTGLDWCVCLFSVLSVDTLTHAIKPDKSLYLRDYF